MMSAAASECSDLCLCSTSQDLHRSMQRSLRRCIPRRMGLATCTSTGDYMCTTNTESRSRRGSTYLRPPSLSNVTVSTSNDLAVKHHFLTSKSIAEFAFVTQCSFRIALQRWLSSSL
ncbi:hypothetical protein C8Q76DRAFT_237609 [Earliella scabrosa]|nr:hypothetical protein C8Q76DRAFT_237609 [Earliella scabrosa]